MTKVMIVTSPYYEAIANDLLKGSCTALDALGYDYDIFEAAGALEIPLSIKYGIEKGQYDAFLALGCVIRGETSHYDIVCNESAKAIMNLSLDHNVPIGNAILTCDDMQQAITRASPEQKNKGKDAVYAIEKLLELKNTLNN